MLARLEKPVHRDSLACIRQIYRRCCYLRHSLCVDDENFEEQLAQLNVLISICGAYFGQGEDFVKFNAATQFGARCDDEATSMSFGAADFVDEDDEENNAGDGASCEEEGYYDEYDEEREEIGSIEGVTNRARGSPSSLQVSYTDSRNLQSTQEGVYAGVGYVKETEDGEIIDDDDL